MYNKRIISALVATVLTVSLIAPASITSYAKNSDIAENQTYESEETGFGTGYIELDNINIPDVLYDTQQVYDGYNADKAAVYPVKYRTADLPEVRNQGSYGVCWAFATMSLVEINLLKKRLVSSDIDLSELHMINYTYNCVEDKLGGLAGDKNAFVGNDILQKGGNVEFAVNALEDWEGAVAEETLPFNYDNALKVQNNQLDDSLAYRDTVAHIQGFYKINTSSKENVKKAIMDYGAIAASYYVDINTNYGSPNYNNINAAYYCYVKNKKTNHAISIVGWDDDYSADNFNTKPDGNGAWIVRNSWGSDYGDNGYFYLSYYDKSLSNIAYALDADLSDNYDNNYQYDGTMMHFGMPMGGYISKAANVFTANANPGEYEQIKAISFESYNSNTDYKVSIYANLTDITNPESGRLVAEKTGTVSYAGMYTLDLDKIVSVAQGDSFSVVVELTGIGDSTPCIAYDGNMPPNGWFECESSAKENQSFMYRDYNNQWEDFGIAENANFNIKAYTDNTTDFNIVDVENITLDKNNIELEQTATEQLKAIIEPEDATYRDVVWSSSNSEVASVDAKGKVTANDIGTSVITATARNGKSASCTVTVKIKEIPINSISLNQSYCTLDKDGSIKLYAVVEPDNTTYSKNIEWSSSNVNVATVDADGNVKAMAEGIAEITAKTVNGMTASCFVYVNETHITYIEMDDSRLVIKEGNSHKLNVKVYPNNTTDDKTITWTSSDDTIASVDSDGTVTAKKEGSAIITAESINGIKISCSLDVIGQYIKVYEKDTVKDIQNRFKKDNFNRIDYRTVVNDVNGKNLSDTDKVGTGCVLQYYKVDGSSEIESSDLYILGDVDGDGVITVLDMEAIQKDILGIQKVEGIYRKAAQIAGDSKEISVLDMEKIQKHVLGIESIQ